MTNLLPGINLKTIICCAVVSAFISYGSCAFYLSLKGHASKIFYEKAHQYESHRLPVSDGAVAFK